MRRHGSLCRRSLFSLPKVFFAHLLIPIIRIKVKKSIGQKEKVFAMLHAEHAFVEGKALCEILRRDDDVVDVLDVHSIFSLLADELLIFILS